MLHSGSWTGLKSGVSTAWRSGFELFEQVGRDTHGNGEYSLKRVQYSMVTF